MLTAYFSLFSKDSSASTRHLPFANAYTHAQTGKGKKVIKKEKKNVRGKHVHLYMCSIARCVVNENIQWNVGLNRMVVCIWWWQLLFISILRKEGKRVECTEKEMQLTYVPSAKWVDGVRRWTKYVKEIRTRKKHSSQWMLISFFFHFFPFQSFAVFNLSCRRSYLAIQHFSPLFFSFDSSTTIHFALCVCRAMRKRA